VRLVVITQRVDAEDPALGATVAKLRALAAHVDELVVLTLAARPVDLPSNVRVKEFGGKGRLLRGARLVGLLIPELRRRPVAVLAHMSPIYAVLAAPVTRPFRIPLLLWFTHWRQSPTLRLAERLATKVLSVSDQSFPLPSRKVVATGHGIEVPRERPAPRADDGTLRLVSLGRTSAAKGLSTVIEAVHRLADLPVEAELRGPSLTEAEQTHRRELEALIEQLGLEGRVRIEGPVAQSATPSVYARSDVLVNNMRSGALDKVVYEAAAFGLPVVVASEGFAPLVGGVEPPLRFAQDDASDLAERLRALHAAGSERRRAIGGELRERVVRDHSVERWAERVVEAAR
jgi:glycosyltransferase involved in cell wall biosynthesis